MKKDELLFVSFEPYDNAYRALFDFKAILSEKIDIENISEISSKLYGRYIKELRIKIDHINDLKKNRILCPARSIWEIGNIIMNMVSDFSIISLQIDGIYEHLSRDLQVKRKWLEKVIILRRYIANIDVIPKTLNWGKCEKGTKKVAISLVNKYREKKG